MLKLRLKRLTKTLVSVFCVPESLNLLQVQCKVMQQSASRRAAIVKRLLSLNISTQQELQDIVKLTAIICKTPVALITLLDDEKQHMALKWGTDVNEAPLESAFCSYTIAQQEIVEVQDILLDERFANNPRVTSSTAVRFYAGSPLIVKTGESLGTLCVIDQKPNALSEDQKQMLQILSRQIVNILEFEMSLKLLKEEIAKVQESEFKLKAIFQSSPVTHILLNKAMQVLAFNKAAADHILLLNKKVICEGAALTLFMSDVAADMLITHFKTAVSGKRVSIEQKINYGLAGTYWWEVTLNPAFDHNNDIMGVTMDVTNITSKVQDRESIVAQNTALKEIAQIQSHEMRRPVANILGLLNILEMPHSPDYNLHIRYIREEATALDKKIHQIVYITDKKLKH